MQLKLKSIIFAIVTLLIFNISNADPKVYALISYEHNQQISTNLSIYGLADDGSPQSIIVDHTIDSMKPNAIAIKPDSDLMFISSSNYHTVFICKLDHKRGDLSKCDPTDLSLQHPMGMTLSGNQFYVTDSVTGSVETCEVTGIKFINCHSAIQHIGDASQITISHTSRSSSAYILQPSLGIMTQCNIDNKSKIFERCTSYSLVVPKRGAIHPIAIGNGDFSSGNHSAGLYLMNGNYSDKNGVSCKISSGKLFDMRDCGLLSLPGRQPATAMMMLNVQDDDNRDLAIISTHQQVYYCGMKPQHPMDCDLLINIQDHYKHHDYIYGVAYKF